MLASNSQFFTPNLNWDHLEGRSFVLGEDKLTVGRLIRFHPRVDTRLSIKGVSLDPTVYLVVDLKKVGGNRLDSGSFNPTTEVKIQRMHPNGALDTECLTFTLNSHRADSIPYSAFEMVGEAERVVQFVPIPKSLKIGDGKRTAIKLVTPVIEVAFSEPLVKPSEIQVPIFLDRKTVLARCSKEIKKTTARREPLKRVELRGMQATETDLKKLTPRLLEAFKEFQKGSSVERAAIKLHVSPKTTETYQTKLRAFFRAHALIQR